ncbi:MAG: prepilin-type N-terminal cleavage/methylation domain-containing protein [Sedimentisphaerales bacterium]|nr:prepilin-type N-terminal cleavage/methylation domain-containing protein [Sedimentisphaerales bacterium]
MKRTLKPKSCGFTIVELIIAVVVTMIVALGMGIVWANSQRAYQVTYDKVYADVVTDSFVARRLFDSTVRKSSAGSIALGSSGEFAEFQYYNNDDSTYLDRYTRFYVSDTDLMAEYGSLNEAGEPTTLNTDTVCGNVDSCVFRNNGGSVRMILTLDDGDKSNVIVTSAFTHN